MEDHLTDLMTPWCVHTVATLRVAHHIDAGVSRIEQLAARTQSDERALHNVLSHLVSKGVFEEPEPGRFALNAAARELRDDPFLDLDGIGGRFARAWETIPTYVRTGRADGYAERFGRPYWDDLAAHPALAEQFDALMGLAGHGTPNADLRLEHGWDGVRTVVDVGGGDGAFLTALLAARPHVHATLLDLPGTVERATGPFETAGQSFFDPLPAGADLYLVRKVLGDWPDAETDRILERLAEAAAPHSRIVVMGGVAPDDAPRRLEIEMVLCGGRTDTLDGFTQRAGRAGLRVVAAGPQPAGPFVVELTRS